MRVLFVSPATKRNVDPLTTPLGLLSIATYLKHNNHTVMIYESEVKKGRFRKTLREFLPDIIGVSVISGKAVDNAIHCSGIAKKAGIKVVWGGFLASAMPELSLKTDCVDIISVGEGEHTWLELLECLEAGRPLETVQGLAFIKDGNMIQTACRELTDLSTLPDLDWELLDVNRYFYSYYSSKKTISLYTSKGCPGRCTFCYNAKFNRGVHRNRPDDQVIRDVSHLIEKYGLECACFNDDLMFANKEQMYSFCAAIQEAGLEFFWGCSSIIGILSKEEFQCLYEAGCRWIFFGIESGSEKMLRKIKKGINYKAIEQTFTDCANAGIVARAAFILGFPGETEDDLKKTVSLALRLMTTQVSFNYFSLVPNSEVYLELLNNKKLEPPEELQGFIAKYPFDRINKNFSCIPDKDLVVVYSYFVLRRLFKKDEVSTGKSWKAITSGYIFKTLKEFSIGKLVHSFNLVFRSFLSVLLNPGIRKKYGLTAIGLEYKHE